MDLLSKGANVLIDGAWGSVGKGKLGAYLASNSKLDFATADYQPNAGHTVIFEGKSYVLKCIPASFVNRNTLLYISPSSTLNVATFLKELDMLSEFNVRDRIWIHPNVGILTQEDIDEESKSMVGIASTMQGVGAALARKVRRKAKTALETPELQQWIDRDTGVLFKIIRDTRFGAKTLIETAQGFDLSLNFGMKYPYVTSRDVTTASALANLGMPPQLLGRVWGALRTYPIRVGHVVKDGAEVGNSGPYYVDQKELTWDEVTRRSGSPNPLLEMTTVTKRVRRIFTWSAHQYYRFLVHCQPTDIFLNFVNYLDWKVNNATEAINSDLVSNFVHKIEMAASTILGAAAPKVRLLGTGPNQEHMVVLL